MPRRTDSIQLDLQLDEGAPQRRALVEALRGRIARGRLKAGTRMPASRDLARQLGIARGTVVSAYMQLVNEGYLGSRHGSGTFVSNEGPRSARAEPPFKSGRAATCAPSSWGRRVVTSPFLPHPRNRPRPFRVHVPAVDVFPLEIWTRLVARRARREDTMWLDEADVQGYRPLRELLVDHLHRSRGVVCSVEQVVMLPSVQQAFDLITRLTLDPGDEVWCEDPGYSGARTVFHAHGAEIVPVAVDEQGIRVAAGIEAAPRAKLAYVTPSHQAPLGVTTSLTRRLELLQWASNTGALIIEDDYDSEFVYESRVVPSLQSLDQNGVVIHTGTFSKTMLPSLRLAFVVLPESLLERFVVAKSICERYTTPLLQVALADFLEQGHFGRHLRRMRELYAERRAALLRALLSELAGAIDVVGANAGLDLTIRWEPGIDDQRVVEALLENRVEANALSPYALAVTDLSGLVLGFAPFSPGRLRKAVETLASVLRFFRRS